MTETMDCSEVRLSLGVYVLGAIDPAERALVDSHLAGCRDCRDELAGLAGLPALLARVGAEEAIALAATDGPPAEEEADWSSPAGRQGQEPPRELLGAVLDLTAARRRRRRWREAGLSVAAALIIAAGVFGGLRLSSSPAQPAQGSSISVGPASGPWATVSGQAQGMSATVMYRPMGWGTQLAAKVTGIPVGTTCDIWVLEPDGSRVLAGSWVTDNNEGAVWYPSSAAVSGQTVHEFVITVGKTRSITVAA
jgi:predicted anti-sigma-YlaC factor YlaD